MSDLLDVTVIPDRGRIVHRPAACPMTYPSSMRRPSPGMRPVLQWSSLRGRTGGRTSCPSFPLSPDSSPVRNEPHDPTGSVYWKRLRPAPSVEQVRPEQGNDCSPLTMREVARPTTVHHLHLQVLGSSVLAEDAQVGVEVIRRSAGVGMVEAEHPTAPLERVLAWIAGGGAPTALEAEHPQPG